MVPVGNRGPAPDRCAATRLGHVEGLMEHMQDWPTASEITPAQAPPRQQAVLALDPTCRPDRGDADATGRYDGARTVDRQHSQGAEPADDSGREAAAGDRVDQHDEAGKVESDEAIVIGIKAVAPVSGPMRSVPTLPVL